MHFIAQIIDVLLKHCLNVNSRSELRIATFMRSTRILFFDEFTFFFDAPTNPPLPPNEGRRITMLVKGSSAAI